jgi:hypothetical protein
VFGRRVGGQRLNARTGGAFIDQSHRGGAGWCSLPEDPARHGIPVDAVILENARVKVASSINKAGKQAGGGRARELAGINSRRGGEASLAPPEIIAEWGGAVEEKEWSRAARRPVPRFNLLALTGSPKSRSSGGRKCASKTCTLSNWRWKTAFLSQVTIEARNGAKTLTSKQ